MPGPVEALIYTIPKAARALGVSRKTLRRMIERGDIPVLRFGRRVLVSRAALAKWMATKADSAVPGQ